MKQELTLDLFKEAASTYVDALRNTLIPDLYGTTDGKAIGTYVEHEFQETLQETYTYEVGSSASGIDFPSLNVDLKVTSSRQPQSSCPFSSASEKVYGLSYHLLVFVYDKEDDHEKQAARLDIPHAVFLSRERTADFQTTYGIREILRREGNKEDLMGFLEERNLPLDDIGRKQLAQRILDDPPLLGYPTMSNALQWRMQYSRVITFAEEGDREGVESLLV